MTETDEPRRATVFFQRRAYRWRRVQDAARILPLIGVFAWLLPLLWAREGPEAPAMGTALIYLFSIWALLIIVGAVLSRRLVQPERAENERGAE